MPHPHRQCCEIVVVAASAGGVEALHARMPRSALDSVAVDHCLPVCDIARRIGELAGDDAGTLRELLLDGRLGALGADGDGQPEASTLV